MKSTIQILSLLGIISMLINLPELEHLNFSTLIWILNDIRLVQAIINPFNLGSFTAEVGFLLPLAD